MNGIGDAGTLESLGLRWQPSGHSVLSGKLLELAERLDQAFVALARGYRATEYRFPTFVSASELNKLDYFRSFPHLISFPVCLDPQESNLERFVRQDDVLSADGELLVTKTVGPREILTPAACYHIYIHEQGQSFKEATYYTTRNTCFRCEQYYSPLRRQRSFSMREVVCVGSLEEVKAFLSSCRALVEDFLVVTGIPVEWKVATDPFFQPSKNAKYIAQRVNPSKTEAVFDGDLAIASVNLHQDHFGHAFELSRGGEPAFTGCVAFGLERWLYAILSQHGLDAARWPTLSSSSAPRPRREPLPAQAGDA